MSHSAPVTPADNGNPLSLHEIQNNIANLLESLESKHDEYTKREMDAIQYNTSNILNKFRNNASLLEHGLKGIIFDLKSGTLSHEDLEEILEAEAQKGLYAMEVANRITKDLREIFESINTQFVNMKNGQPLSEECMSNFLQAMDRSMDGALSITKVASTPVNKAMQSLSLLSSERLHLSKSFQGDNEGGYFTQLLLELQRAQMSRSSPLNFNTYQQDSEIDSESVSSIGDAESLRLSQLSISQDENDVSQPTPDRKREKRKHKSQFKIESAFLARTPNLVKGFYGAAIQEFQKKEEKKQIADTLYTKKIRSLGNVTSRVVSVTVNSLKPMGDISLIRVESRRGILRRTASGHSVTGSTEDAAWSSPAHQTLPSLPSSPVHGALKGADGRSSPRRSATFLLDKRDGRNERTRASDPSVGLHHDVVHGTEVVTGGAQPPSPMGHRKGSNFNSGSVSKSGKKTSKKEAASYSLLQTAMGSVVKKLQKLQAAEEDEDGTAADDHDHEITFEAFEKRIQEMVERQEHLEREEEVLRRRERVVSKREVNALAVEKANSLRSQLMEKEVVERAQQMVRSDLELGTSLEHAGKQASMQGSRRRLLQGKSLSTSSSTKIGAIVSVIHSMDAGALLRIVATIASFLSVQEDRNLRSATTRRKSLLAPTASSERRSVLRKKSESMRDRKDSYSRQPSRELSPGSELENDSAFGQDDRMTTTMTSGTDLSPGSPFTRRWLYRGSSRMSSRRGDIGVSEGMTADLLSSSLTSFDLGDRNPSKREKILETIVIYPINTAHKATDTADLPGVLTNSERHATDGETHEPGISVDVSVRNHNAILTQAGLMRADNPLLVIYDSFKLAIPELSRARLLCAVTGTANLNEHAAANSLQKIMTPILEEMQRMRYSVVEAEVELKSCERLYLDLSLIAGKAFGMSSEFTSERISREIGKLCTSAVLLQMQLAEFRSIFDFLSASELAKMPDLLRGCVPYQKSLLLFQDCQGRVYNFVSALDLLRNTWRRASQSSPTQVSSLELESLKAELQQTKFAKEVAVHDLAELKEQFSKMEQDLFEARLVTDRTPSALLFFSTLIDEGTIPNLQQLALQLSHLRDFVDGKEHIDFPTLRRRLQVCVNCLPSTSKFLSRYANVHYKWTQNRVKTFLERNQYGGDADSALICPFCNLDSRQLPSCRPNTSSGDASAWPRRNSLGGDSPERTGFVGSSQSRPTTRSGRSPARDGRPSTRDGRPSTMGGGRDARSVVSAMTKSGSVGAGKRHHSKSIYSRSTKRSHPVQIQIIHHDAQSIDNMSAFTDSTSVCVNDLPVILP